MALQQTNWPSANTSALSKHIGFQQTHWFQGGTWAFSKPIGRFANTFAFSKPIGLKQSYWPHARFPASTLASGKHMGPFSKPIGLLHKHLRQATPLAFIRHMGFQTANWFPGQTFASGNNMGRKPIGLLRTHGP